MLLKCKNLAIRRAKTGQLQLKLLLNKGVSILVVAVALGPGGGRGWRDKLWTAAVLPTMHLSWGWGFVIGVLRGAHDTVDTSRLGDRNTPLP